jgi:hypothetical protein
MDITIICIEGELQFRRRTVQTEVKDSRNGT